MDVFKGGRNGVATILLVLVGLISAANATAQTDPGAVNTADRESERAWFNTWWPRSFGADMGYTGNVDQGVPGDIAPAYRDQILLRLNIYRRLMGEQPLSTNATYNTDDQAAAALCAANDNVSHNPPTTWKFYNVTAATACASSDLNGVAGPSGITVFMNDGGPDNKAVGHRLSLTPPALQAVGIGCAPGHPNTILESGVLAVWNNDSSVGSSNLQYTDPFVLWPSKGFIPYYLIPGRWSVSIPDDLTTGTLDLTNATVAVTRNGHVLSNVTYGADNGGPAIVFTLDGSSEGGSGFQHLFVDGELLDSSQLPAADTTYHIIVSNIKIRSSGVLWNGTGKYEYDVIEYDPSVGQFVQSQQSDLVNISTRSLSASGSSTQIAGFVLRGSEPRKVLVRAGGPYLSNFGVQNVLSDPTLTLFANGVEIRSNDDWSPDAEEISLAVKQVGTLQFESGSKDAAVVTMVQPGVLYTAQVSGKGSATGNAIVEIFDADNGAASSLTNISTRSYVGLGSDIQIAGFVLKGTGPRKVLIRAGGPYLTQFHVDNVLVDPVLTIFKDSIQIVQNDDWELNNAEVTPACLAVGAPLYATGSTDAAIVLTVVPGVSYTAQVSGKNGGSGNAIVEVFSIP